MTQKEFFGRAKFHIGKVRTGTIDKGNAKEHQSYRCQKEQPVYMGAL
jgi:hypothetical protein